MLPISLVTSSVKLKFCFECFDIRSVVFSTAFQNVRFEGFNVSKNKGFFKFHLSCIVG